jgi:predicted nucleic acid-binding protein
MRRGILDTSIVIARFDDADLDSTLPDQAALSVATIAELHYGVLVARNRATRSLRLARLGAVESTFQALPIDAAIARAFARLAHEVKRSGPQPRARVMDLWIAATALVHGVALYTRNATDFRGLDKVVEIRVV